MWDFTYRSWIASLFDPATKRSTVEELLKSERDGLKRERDPVQRGQSAMLCVVYDEWLKCHPQ